VRWAVLAPLAAEDPQIPEGIPEWRRGSELLCETRYLGIK